MLYLLVVLAVSMLIGIQVVEVVDAKSSSLALYTYLEKTYFGQ